MDLTNAIVWVVANLKFAQQQAKVGLAVSIETAPEELMNAAQSSSASAPSVPF